MTSHLSQQDIRELRRFIVADRQRDPFVAEQEVFRRFLEEHPTLADQVNWSRFRNHFRAVREYARRQKKAVHELRPEEAVQITASRGRRRRSAKATSSEHLVALQRQLSEAKERKRALSAELAAVEHEIRVVTQNLRQVLQAFTDELELA